MNGEEPKFTVRIEKCLRPNGRSLYKFKAIIELDEVPRDEVLGHTEIDAQAAAEDWIRRFKNASSSVEANTMHDEADTDFHMGWMISTQRSHDAALPVLAVAEKLGRGTLADTGLDIHDAVKNVKKKIEHDEASGS